MTNSMPSPILITGAARSGIYEILCIPTGKRYIGSAIDLRCRLRDHRAYLRRSNHHNRYLQRAWNKYGENKFVFRILLYCHKADLIFYEQRAIDLYQVFDSKQGYNLSPTAGSQLGYKHYESTKKKIGKNSRLG